LKARHAYPNLLRWSADRFLRRQSIRLFSEALDSGKTIAPRPEAPIIVIGMHRSGTTLTTRLLEDLGVSMGNWQARQTSEAMYFRRRNEAMLGLANTTWDNPEPFVRALEKPQWQRALTHVAANHLGTFRTRNFAPPLSTPAATHPPVKIWGFKDPRTSLTLPVWTNLFPNAKIVHVVRNPEAVATSLNVRGIQQLKSHLSLSLVSLDREFCHNLWAVYVETAEKHLEKIANDKKLEIRYEDLTTNPTNELKKLAAFASSDVSDDELASIAQRVKQSVDHEPMAGTT